MERFQTSRYEIEIKEIARGGPGGYESTYLSSEGDSATEEFYELLGDFKGVFLPAENRSIRQRNGLQLIEALKCEKSLGIASGFKPSGAYHFGHKLTSGTVAFMQKNGVQVFMPIADVECDMENKMSKEDYMYWAADNLVDWGANGVNLDASHVYLQSEEKRVSDIAYLVARGLTFDLAVDTYGFKKMVEEFPFLFAGITQVGDILLPQHRDFGNYHSFMVSGQDQDGHMKMAVELTKRAFNSGIPLFGIQTIPSGFYIPHIRGIIGKASSSKPEFTFYLGSAPQKESLDVRIESTLRKFDKAKPYHLKRCTLDMMMYLDEFNSENKIDFRTIVGSSQYNNLVRIRDLQKSNDTLLEMDENEFEIVKVLFNEYLEIELKKAKSNEEIREKIYKEEIRIKNQFLSQHRVDDFLIQACENYGQNNLEIVREILPLALRDHQKKRQVVLDYAVKKENYRDYGAWAIDSEKVDEPNFWDIPDKARVNQNLRNKTQWFNIVASMKERIIP